jgi:hypothetical protein
MSSPFSPLFALPEAAREWDSSVLDGPDWAPPDPDDGPWEYLGSYYPYREPDAQGRLPAKQLQDVCDVWRSVDPQDTMVIYCVVDGYDRVQHACDVNDDSTLPLAPVVFEDEPEKLTVVRIEHAIRYSQVGHTEGRWAFTQQDGQLGLVVSACTSEQYQLLVAEAFQRTMAWMAAEDMRMPTVDAMMLSRCAEKMWEVIQQWQACLTESSDPETSSSAQAPTRSE